MKKKKERRTKLVRAYIADSEYTALQNEFQKSVSREFADFIRRLLLRKPVVKKYRNRSLDDILECLVEIKTCLESAEWNFAKILQRVQELPPGNISQGILEYLLTGESNYRAEAKDIKRILIKIYEECSQLQNPPQA